LFAGAFFAFSALGFIVDTLQAVVYHPGFTLVVAAGCGALAVAYAYAMFDRRWMLIAVVAQCVFIALVIVFRPDGQPLSAATTGAIRTKLIVDGLGCFVAFLASYTAFMSFIGREGARYMRTHAEIELAGEIHRHLVPAVATKADRFEFHGLSLPSQEVGGDLVDLVRLDRGWIGYIADVSGHGVGSGLLMGIVKSAVRTRLRQDAALDRLLTDVNPVVCDLSKPNMFVTVAAVHCDSSDQLTFATAGHLPILHYSADRAFVEELTTPQIPLGVFEDTAFASAAVASRRGDIYALVTDGLTEVFDANDNELGLEPVKQMIRAHASRPLREIADCIVNVSRGYGAQQDDQTVLLIRVVV
jgi:serine phosphatase RsbU (regulator of sigma subunit)